jgi:hypothetical protein
MPHQEKTKFSQTKSFSEYQILRRATWKMGKQGGLEAADGPHLLIACWGLVQVAGDGDDGKFT